MGGTSIKFAVVQGSAILDRAEPMPTADFPGPEAVISEVGRRLRAFMDRHGGAVRLPPCGADAASVKNVLFIRGALR